MRHHVNVRRFLNRRGFHAGAFVLAQVSDSTACRNRSCVKEGHRWCVDPRLDIADCSRQISLDFSVETPAAAANSIAKARLLAKVLEDFADALEIEAERAVGYRRTARRTGHKIFDLK